MEPLYREMSTEENKENEEAADVDDVILPVPDLPDDFEPFTEEKKISINDFSKALLGELVVKNNAQRIADLQSEIDTLFAMNSLSFPDRRPSFEVSSFSLNHNVSRDGLTSIDVLLLCVIASRIAVRAPAFEVTSCGPPCMSKL
eukprot:1745969-Amphidinium_carterae.1